MPFSRGWEQCSLYSCMAKNWPRGIWEKHKEKGKYDLTNISIWPISRQNGGPPNYFSLLKKPSSELPSGWATGSYNGGDHDTMYTHVTQRQLMRHFAVKSILSSEQKCKVRSKFLKNKSMLKNELWHILWVHKLKLINKWQKLMF